MAAEVKQRSGRTARAAKARATRRRIVDAARDAFLQEGYAATTLDRVARDADVAVQTVYFHFGNKRTVLKEVIDVITVGDDQPVPLLERAWVRNLQTAPDAVAALSVWMDMSREIYERVAPIMRMVREASATDPEMAEQWQTSQQQTLAAHRFLAQVLADRGWLQEGLAVDDAADVLFALISLDMYVLLTMVRGWTAARWESWTTEVAASAVLSTTKLDA